MIDQIVRLTCRRSLSLAEICNRLVESEKDVRAAIKEARADGYPVAIRDGYVTTRAPVGAHPTITAGTTKPGRVLVPIVTDTHFGSTHCLEDQIVRFSEKAWNACERLGIPEKQRAGICTGDVLDGNKPVLLPDQSYVGFDHQRERAVRTMKRAAPFKWIALDGNHDGYYSSSIGFTSGELLASSMQENGVDWNFAGVCLGRAIVHGAYWHLWHPHGGAGTRNAVRRILNARSEGLSERCDVVAMGHFHKFCGLHVYPENIFGVAGGTFQAKRSEFANRLMGDWDVGGTMVHYTVHERGQVNEFSATFHAAKG